MTEQDHSREVRDRVVRLEANLENLKDSHNVTKTEFAAFKKEMLAKFDELAEDINKIKLTLAKYLGGFAVVMFIGELAIKYFMH